MGERIVTDVVQQCSHPHGKAVLLHAGRKLTQLLQRSNSSARQVIGAQCVLEPGVRGTGVYQEAVSDLADVS
jgi:hypothetical protein